MRIAAVIVAMLMGSSTAYAQPGAPPPPPPNYPPPPPYQYQPAANYPAPPLTAEEHELLLEGEISDGARVGGGIANFFIGYGVGQAIQGRWSDTGWIFTLGEVASMAVFISGVFRTFDDCTNSIGENTDCDHSDGPPLIILGALGAGVFRIWGTIDAFSGPSDHNRRVRDLKFRLGIPVQVGHRLSPFVHKTRDGGATAGLQLSF
jgi:hypothetical protein